MTVLSKPPGRVSFELGPAQAAQYQQPPKMEWWESMFGPSPGAPPSSALRPLPPTQPAPSAPASILVPAPTSAPSAPPVAPPGTPGLPSSTGSPLHLPPPPPALTPFPNTFASLPRHERKLWEAMRKEELRAWKEWERACRAAMKADEERKRREGKEKVKREKVLEKQKQKEAKLAAKLGYRPLPQLKSTPTPTAPTASAAVPRPTSQSAPPNPAFGSGAPPQWNSTSWAHLPPLEEFGVRRPFDAPGRPGVDIGGTEWPKMSRTMTHV